MTQIVKKEENIPSVMYQNAVDIGTEEMSQEDLNTPILKIIQPTTQDIPNKKDGSWYRTDLKEQFDEVKVNLVYVSTSEVENFNKTGMEKVKVYFGFYEDTNQPFKMYVRGWGLQMHRQFQSEVAYIKNQLKVPMLSLSVKLTTEKQTGTIGATGKPYTIYKPVFNIERVDGIPTIEMNSNRITFLVEAASRFKTLPTSDNDNAQNDIPVNPEDVPF